MLSEERWIFVLSNLDHEINKRVAQIELESTRTFANPHLTNVEKLQIIKEKNTIFTSMVSCCS